MPRNGTSRNPSFNTASWHDEVSVRKFAKEAEGYKPEADAMFWHTQAHLPQHCEHAEYSSLTLMVGIQAMQKQETNPLCEDHDLGGRAAMKEGVAK